MTNHIVGTDHSSSIFLRATFNPLPPSGPSSIVGGPLCRFRVELRLIKLKAEEITIQFIPVGTYRRTLHDYNPSSWVLLSLTGPLSQCVTNGQDEANHNNGGWFVHFNDMGL